jgi:hypothetical protein
MHSWHIAYQGLFQSLNLIPSKNIVPNAFYPKKKILETKMFQKESKLK